MTTQTLGRTALTAGLALLALAGPLLAGPLGNQGYAPTNGYAANGYSAGNGYNVSASVGAAPSGGCATCATPIAASGHPGHKGCCPPPYYHVYEGPPNVKFKKGCPRPVCDPCELPHFGYFQTCWTPWPYPPDWRHCPNPTPSDMLPPPTVPPYTPKLNAERDPEPLREPRRSPTSPKKKPAMDEDPDDDAPPKGGKQPPERLGPPDKLDKDRGTQSRNEGTTRGNVRLVTK